MLETKESVNASMIDIFKKFEFCPFCNKDCRPLSNEGSHIACYENSHTAYITMTNSFRIERFFYKDEILYTFKMWLLDSGQCKILIDETKDIYLLESQWENLYKSKKTRLVYIINDGEKVFDTIIQCLKEENFQKINKLLCLY